MEPASATQQVSKESEKSSHTPGSRPLGIHPNSVAANLDKLDPETRAKYYRNRDRAEGDYQAMRRWAEAGFLPVEDESIPEVDHDGP